MGVSGQRHTPSEPYPRGRPIGTHWTGGWVGLRAGLDTEDRGKIICPCRGSNPDCPVVQPIVRHYTAWATRLLQLIMRRCNFGMAASAMRSAAAPSYKITPQKLCTLCTISLFTRLRYNPIFCAFFRGHKYSTGQNYRRIPRPVQGQSDVLCCRNLLVRSCAMNVQSVLLQRVSVMREFVHTR
jgi:hypothetical protein